jgi:hypothetical protein
MIRVLHIELLLKITVRHTSPLATDLLKPRYTCPNVPLPSRRPFFQREPGLVGFSALPGLRGTGEVVADVYVGEKEQEFEIVNGGRGKRWLCCFPSSGRVVGESVAAPPARGCRGVTAPLCILELGPGLVILGLGIGEHSGLHLLCGQNSCPVISPPTELCPEL